MFQTINERIETTDRARADIEDLQHIKRLFGDMQEKLKEYAKTAKTNEAERGYDAARDYIDDLLHDTIEPEIGVLEDKLEDDPRETAEIASNVSYALWATGAVR